MVATYRDYTDLHHDRLLLPYPGIDGVLAALRRDGARLAIVTSKTHALARRGLARCGLAGCFDVVIGMDDVTPHKPHPAPVQAALSRLSAAPERAVFIGDSPYDIQAGRAAGVRTAAVLWGAFERERLDRETPDYWLSDPSGIAAHHALTASRSSMASARASASASPISISRPRYSGWNASRLSRSGAGTSREPRPRIR